MNNYQIFSALITIGLLVLFSMLGFAMFQNYEECSHVTNCGLHDYDTCMDGEHVFKEWQCNERFLKFTEMNCDQLLQQLEENDEDEKRQLALDLMKLKECRL